MSKIVRRARIYFLKLWRKSFFIIYTIISSLTCKTSAFMQDVRLGYKVRFLGITHFSIKPGSKTEIGSNCTFRSGKTTNLIGINRPCIISTHSHSARISIGNDCGFSGTVIGAFDCITIGNKVRCGANTLITDSDWHPDDPRTSSPSPIVIEDNVWLGVNVVFLKGVRIGRNSVIGANSLVTKDIPADVLAAGNPCKVIKRNNGKTE